MSRKRFTTEQIIHRLREAEVEIAKGKLVPEACRQIGVTEQTFYRWRKAYGASSSTKPNSSSDSNKRTPGSRIWLRT